MELSTKTGGQVTDDKSAGVSQFSNIMAGGPMWRHEHEMRPCTLLGWDCSTARPYNAIDTTYRIGNADCAKVLFGDNGDSRSYGTDSEWKGGLLEAAVRNGIWDPRDDT